MDVQNTENETTNTITNSGHSDKYRQSKENMVGGVSDSHGERYHVQRDCLGLSQSSKTTFLTLCKCCCSRSTIKSTCTSNQKVAIKYQSDSDDDGDSRARGNSKLRLDKSCGDW